MTMGWNWSSESVDYVEKSVCDVNVHERCQAWLL